MIVESRVTSGVSAFLLPSGSGAWRAAGIFHICVIKSGNASGDSADYDSELFYREGQLWEVVSWSQESLWQLLNGIEQQSPAHYTPSPRVLSPAEVQLLDCVGRGEILYGEAVARSWKERLARSSINMLVARRENDHAAQLIERAMCHSAAGEAEQSVLAALGALSHAIDGFLALYGFLSPDPVERYKRYARTLEKVPAACPLLSASRYWQLQTMQSYANEPIRWTNECVEACLALAAMVEYPDLAQWIAGAR